MSNPRHILTQAVFALQMANPESVGVVEPNKSEIKCQQKAASARLFARPSIKKHNNINRKEPIHQPRGQNHR